MEGIRPACLFCPAVLGGRMTVSGLEPIRLLLFPPVLPSQHGGLSLWSSLGPSLL